MLVLSRKIDQEILINGNIKISILKIKGNVVRIGIEAPAEVNIKRGELVSGEGPAEPLKLPTGNGQSDAASSDKGTSDQGTSGEGTCGEGTCGQQSGYRLLPLSQRAQGDQGDHGESGFKGAVQSNAALLSNRNRNRTRSAAAVEDELIEKFQRRSVPDSGYGELIHKSEKRA